MGKGARAAGGSYTLHTNVLGGQSSYWTELKTLVSTGSRHLAVIDIRYLWGK